MPRKKVIYSHGGGKRYQTFLDKLSSHHDKSIEDWNEYQLMGYFVTQIKEHFDQDFMAMLSYEGEPMWNHPQIMMLRKIIVALHQPDKGDFYCDKLEYMPCRGEYFPAKVKAYLDWSIQRIIKDKHQIFSLNYLLRQKDIQNFLNQYDKIDRSKKLPEDLKKILPSCLDTFGDLSFYVQSYSLDQSIIDQIENKGIKICQIV